MSAENMGASPLAWSMTWHTIALQAGEYQGKPVATQGTCPEGAGR